MQGLSWPCRAAVVVWGMVSCTVGGEGLGVAQSVLASEPSPP